MYLTIFDDAEKVRAEGLSIDPASLYCAFEQVKDGRKRRGKRYPLPLLLTWLLLGKLAGETTISGIVQWVRERKGWMREQFCWYKGFPTNSTYSEALARCDGQQIAGAIAQALTKARAEQSKKEERDDDGLTHVAMDGKTLRGTQGHQREGQPSVHLLSLYECESGIVLTQQAVKSKENEISAAAAFLHPALVKGRIVSTDALHTQKKWCAGVHAYGGYYLTIAKENQPQTYEDMRDFFQDKDAEREEWQYEKTVEKKHGRLEIRELWASTQMNEWFEPEWAGIAQIFCLRHFVKEGEKEREEILYGLTNLTRKQANAARLLALQRAHWRIENCLHYRRDVTLGEDACQVRVEGAPQALAALNGGVLALMDWLHVRNTAAQMRHYCAHPAEAVQLLCGALWK